MRQKPSYPHVFPQNVRKGQSFDRFERVDFQDPEEDPEYEEDVEVDDDYCYSYASNGFE